MSQSIILIRGHECLVEVFARLAMGTVDCEVLSCSSCPQLVGQCFRVSGGAL